MLDVKHVHIYPDYPTLSREAAKHVFERIHSALSSGKRYILGMATGATPLGMYDELLTLFRDSGLDFSQFYTVNLDEYFPMKQADPQSYFSYMKLHFWESLHTISSTFDYTKQGLIMNSEATDANVESQRYEDQIKELGGIDLQILGIGTNGHIGFNEPGSSPDSRTRVIQLADKTIQDNSVSFGGDTNAVPKQAITMGIVTILEAREIIVLASGSSKAPMIQALKSATEETKDIPATYLLRHGSVNYFIDNAANLV